MKSGDWTRRIQHPVQSRIAQNPIELDESGKLPFHTHTYQTVWEPLMRINELESLRHKIMAIRIIGQQMMQHHLSLFCEG